MAFSPNFPLGWSFPQTWQRSIDLLNIYEIFRTFVANFGKHFFGKLKNLGYYLPKFALPPPPCIALH